MKTFWRVVGLASPLTGVAIAYFVYALGYNVFGLLNFVLLQPLLDVLFNTVNTQALEKYLQAPVFHGDLSYFRALFNYHFAHIIQAQGKLAALWYVCGVLMATVLLKNIFYYLAMMTRERLRVHVTRNARHQLYHKITHLHLGYFSHQRKGDLLSRMTADVAEVESASQFMLDLLLRDPLALLIYFVVLFSISVELTLFTLLVVPISGIGIAIVSRRLKKKSLIGQNMLGRVLSMLEENLGALRVIKAYNAEEYSRRQFNQANEQYARQVYSIAQTRELASPFSEFAGVSVVAIILLYGGSLILADNSSLSSSEFITYLIIFSQIITPAKAISTAISNIQRGLAAAERIFEITDTPVALQDVPNAQRLESFERSIEFRNVGFRYGDTWVLRGINFTIHKGEKVALVGETGSGKSTLADLMARFYEVEEGEILIDGINLKNIDTHSLRQLMGIVTQEPILFNDSIYNNIAFATQDATPAQVEQAAQVANAHEFILKTEQGYQTNVGDRGMKLSGGQRQRLTIARAVLKNPPILLLDEATSALDTESEKLVQDALQTLMQNRTSLVIAHRLSTIQDAQQIIVLRNGQIVEQGTHQSLIALPDGYYHRLQMLQTNNKQ